MAIAFVRGVSRTGFQNQTSATSGTLAATPTENNVLLMYTYMQDNQTGRVVVPPTGWTLICPTGNDGDEWTNAWMYRIAPAGAATSYTWTWNGNSFNQGSYLFELSGVDTTTPIDTAKANFTYEGFDATWRSEEHTS